MALMGVCSVTIVTRSANQHSAAAIVAVSEDKIPGILWDKLKTRSKMRVFDFL